MKPGNPRPPKYKEAAKDRKNNEGEVNTQDKIRKCPCRHLPILFPSFTSLPGLRSSYVTKAAVCHRGGLLWGLSNSS